MERSHSIVQGGRNAIWKWIYTSVFDGRSLSNSSTYGLTIHRTLCKDGWNGGEIFLRFFCVFFFLPRRSPVTLDGRRKDLINVIPAAETANTLDSRARSKLPENDGRLLYELYCYMPYFFSNVLITVSCNLQQTGRIPDCLKMRSYSGRLKLKNHNWQF